MNDAFPNLEFQTISRTPDGHNKEHFPKIFHRRKMTMNGKKQQQQHPVLKMINYAMLDKLRTISRCCRVETSVCRRMCVCVWDYLMFGKRARRTHLKYILHTKCRINDADSFRVANSSVRCLLGWWGWSKASTRTLH